MFESRLIPRNRIAFSATLPLAMRPEVEALFFFNPGQASISEGIRAAILREGMPEIAGTGDKIWIEIPSTGAQCLFASDAGVVPARVVGVALYSRPTAETILISHLAVDPEYAYSGRNAGLAVATRLLDRIMTIAGVIKGVTQLQLPYRDGCYLRVTHPSAAMTSKAANLGGSLGSSTDQP
jgi:hypothetical protein